MMTLKQIYKLAIDLGIKNDLRGSVAVKNKLIRLNKQFKDLPEKKKAEFDEERLTNPFSDTRSFGDPNKKVKRILVGIDIGVGELLLAKELSKSKPIDLIISHHPLGPGLAGLHEVMDLQVELLAKYGVPINIAESLMHLRMSEVSRSVSPANHNQTLDAAKLLGQDIMCVHTPADNMMASFLDNLIKKSKDKISHVSDLLELLKSVPEYKKAQELKAGPRLFTGREEAYTGKIALTEVTGGTDGSKDIYQHMATAGIGTVVGMHMKEEYREEAEKAHLNIVIAGHMSSDSIGMNLFLDELEKKGIEIVACSGLIRYSRTKGKKKKK